MGQFMDYMIVDKLSVPPDTLSEEISEFVSRTSRIVFYCFVAMLCVNAPYSMLFQMRFQCFLSMLCTCRYTHSLENLSPSSLPLSLKGRVFAPPLPSQRLSFGHRHLRLRTARGRYRRRLARYIAASFTLLYYLAVLSAMPSCCCCCWWCYSWCSSWCSS